MVTNDSRNNIIVMILIFVTAIMTVYSMTVFANQMISTGERTEKIVTNTAKDINVTLNRLISTIEIQANNTGQQLVLSKEEKALQEHNLKTFLGTFQNNSDALLNMTQHQTDEFVKTLQKSQNLTMKSQNISLDNQMVTKNLTEEVEFLNKILNSTYAYNASTGQSNNNVSFIPNTTRLE